MMNYLNISNSFYLPIKNIMNYEFSNKKILNEAKFTSNDLLTWNRFDLTFKLFYLECLENKSKLGRDFYEKHLRAFGLGKIHEPGNAEKNTLSKFIEVFNSIFLSIKKDNFDSNISVIPLSIDGSISNGSHRLSSAIYLNKEVICIKTNELPHIYDYKYFQKRNISTNVLDLMACKFIEYSKNTYIAFMWPSIANKIELAEDILRNIVYKKEVFFNLNGFHNLLSQVYQDEEWLGSFEDNFPGIKGKLNGCFKINEPVTVYAFQAENLAEVTKIKEVIRKRFGIEKNSIHITDNIEESERLSKIIFNINSIKFLNYGLPTKFKKNMNAIKYISNLLERLKIKPNDMAIDGGFILSLYGIRSHKDLDFLSTKDFKEIELEEGFDDHKSQIKFHQKKVEDLIYDPNNYFYYNGLKFIDIQQIFLMKSNRGEQKDKVDCALIRAKLSNNLYLRIKSKSTQFIDYLYLKIYYFIYKYLKKFNLIPIVKFIIGK